MAVTRQARQAPLLAYVLHRYEWSESSLILDVFTREHGRIAVAAKGARRPFSQLRSVLLPFQRIQILLGRRADDGEAREVDTLRAAEWAGDHAMLAGAALFSGFYVNELLMKLMARHDPHPALFDAYAATIAELGQPGSASGEPALQAQAALRAFEIVLLHDIGLLPDLATETATNRPVQADSRYLVLADAGVVASRDDNASSASGATLASLRSALSSRDLPRLQQATRLALAELRPLLRAQLHYHLGSSQLRTRQVMLDAQAL